MPNDKLFTDPRVGLGEKPFFMSKKKWNQLQRDIEEGNDITKKKPFFMSDRRWQELRDSATKAQQQYGINTANMDLFNTLFSDLSGIEGLEGFADLEANYETSFSDILGGFSPMIEQMIQEQLRPQDANLSNFTVDPSIIPNYQDGGEVELSLAQIEKGEMIALPDLSIVEPKSKSTHDKMDGDEITDILPEGAYVFSDKIEITKEQADIIFGYMQPTYEEETNEGEVEELNFSDLFEKNEDKLGTAELARRIQKKFRVEENEEGNLLTETANMENKISRAPYLQTLIELSEMIREKEGEPTNPVQMFKKGGKVKKAKTAKGEPNPQKFDGGGFEIIPWGELFNLGLNIWQMQRQSKQYAQNRAELDALLGRQQQNLGTTSLMNLMTTLGQDPSETAPDMTATLNTYQQQLDRTPGYLRDYSAGQLRSQFGQAARQVFESAPNFATASANLRGLYADTLDRQSQMQAQQNAADVGLRNRYLQGLSSLYSQDAINQAQKANQERSNRNQQLVRTGDTVSNYFNQLSALDTAALNTQFQLQGHNTAAQNAIINSAMQNLMLASSAITDSTRPNEYRAPQYDFRNAYYNVPGPADVRPQQDPFGPWGTTDLLPLVPPPR